MQTFDHKSEHEEGDKIPIATAKSKWKKGRVN